MKINNHILLIISFCFFSFQLFPQENEQNIGKVQVVCKVTSEEIILRWAPTTSLSWKYLNEYGYRIEKYILFRNGKLLKEIEKNELANSTIKVEALEKWEEAVKKDKYNAIAAQAIFGNSFDIQNNAGSMASMVNKAKELENRFAFSLFCADQNFETADLMGLTFTDKDISIDEKYVYKIIPMVPVDKGIIDTGIIYVNPIEITEYPPPYDLKAEFGDRQVMLRWNKSYFEKIYSSYFIERSEDNGSTFYQINTNPLIHPTPNKKSDSRYIFYIDSIPENNKTYLYRIRGKSIFGDISEPSDTVAGEGYKILKINPEILKAEVIDNKSIFLQWSMDKEYNASVEGFDISIANNINGPYSKVDSNLLPAIERKFIIENPMQVNYIKIKAIGIDDHEYSTPPIMVQMEDNDPPAAPLGLEGVVDSSGIVSLKWSNNTEPDLLGYRVYMSNSARDEYTQITRSPVKTPVYYDTININTLTKKVYYKIMAVDIRYNMSKYSEPIELKRPDIIPPVAPVFETVRSNDSCILLTWKKSPSDDVVDYIIFRKSNDSETWDNIATSKIDNELEYKDIPPIKGKKYKYTVKARDESGNISEKSQEVSMALPDRGFRNEIEDINVTADRTNRQIVLSWKNNKEISKIYIYRKVGDNALSLYKTISGENKEFVDSAVQISMSYTYKIRAQYKDGGSTPFSIDYLIKY